MAISFKKFVEAADIFGFEKHKAQQEQQPDPFLMQPIKQFNTELMMDFLSKKSLNGKRPNVVFMNEIHWGNGAGAIKLEVSPTFRFNFKKLIPDIQGNQRWIMKKVFQLNRFGYNGHEDSVAQEVFEYVQEISKQGLDAPLKDFDKLEELVLHVYDKVKITSKQIFIPEGIKKLSDNCFVMKFGIRAAGVEAPNQSRVEQNQTVFTYDKELGTIQIWNSNIESPVGGDHRWKLMEKDFDGFFMPSQSREDIGECLATHFKYY